MCHAVNLTHEQHAILEHCGVLAYTVLTLSVCMQRLDRITHNTGLFAVFEHMLLYNHQARLVTR